MGKAELMREVAVVRVASPGKAELRSSRSTGSTVGRRLWLWLCYLRGYGYATAEAMAIALTVMATVVVVAMAMATAVAMATATETSVRRCVDSVRCCGGVFH